ncbi:energy transducer TonB [Pleionea sp. CnH1-48]|uniref:energy transducer TonB n=1 Tax=Pleionea sp. CnH1-48 TaxID=2954494 RepID=UPI002096CEDE|nr:energy transducer TonB [Pleionea sp. CnH1-48]MCO7222935.1 energy transducer TonB [Pleionea sp. CnH1-48]
MMKGINVFILTGCLVALLNGCKNADVRADSAIVKARAEFESGCDTLYRNAESRKQTLSFARQVRQRANIRPLEIVDTVYPPYALNIGLEGQVRLSFDIDTQGIPTNIKVIESKPLGVFDCSAIGAVEHWRYPVYIENGRPARVKNWELVLNFNLSPDL